MNDKAVFLPFHAINEFMRPDFRLNLIRDVLSNLSSLPQEYATEIASLTKKFVKIPGFRNSEKAPPLVKVMPIARAFEKQPDMVSAILSAWVEYHREWLSQVYEVLKNRGWAFVDPSQRFSLNNFSEEFVNQWPILPPETDRRRAPGFVPRWPKGEDFEAVYSTYQANHPDSNASIDQVSLMTVWLTLRLPYNHEEHAPQAEQMD
jgi:hypothetical protein